LNLKFPPEDRVADHPWIGQEVRGIAERQFAVFDRPGKVKDIKANGDIIWEPEGRLIPWTSHADDVELLPVLKEKGKWKSGKPSTADMMEMRFRLPDLKKQLGKSEMLNDLHVVLGSWLIYRDFLRGTMKPKDMPCLVSSHAVHTFLASESAEVLDMSKDVLEGTWKRHGLLGIPIQVSDHWTLLVLRRAGNVKKVRYYDSLGHVQQNCLAGAKKILELLEPDMKFPEPRNKAVQQDSLSCGLYVLHYWEGEVRQFVGEGWSVGKPTEFTVKKVRDRLINITKEIEGAHGKVLAFPAKKKKQAEVEDVEGDDNGLPFVPAVEKIMEYLTAQAKRSQDAGLVEFYGCSKCRWSRGGCISWMCNHAKFIAHYEKFPEKYAKSADAEQKCKELKVEAEQKLTKWELMNEAEPKLIK
jgi:hypothetical protein